MSENIFLCDPNCTGMSLGMILGILLGWIVIWTVFYFIFIWPTDRSLKELGDRPYAHSATIVLLLAVIFWSLTILLAWK